MADQESNVIVAIPSPDDYVWRTSSEKIPHMTLLYLEDLSTDDDLEEVVLFLQHAVDTSMCKFHLAVDHRGTLGPDNADVVFFSDGDSDPLYGDNRALQKIAEFRQTLLHNSRIAEAYNAVEQYPVWTPHLTLGYPTAPAHPDTRDYPGIDYIQFDKIALWTSDFDGLEFQLKDRSSEMAYWSGLTVAESILEHHGVKGMHWGVRKQRSSEVTTIHTPGKRVKATGGHELPAHDDALKAAISKQRAKKSTTDALGNAELKALVERMNLEQQYSRLSAHPKGEGRKFVEDQLKTHGRQKLAATIAKRAVKVAAVSAVL